MHALEAATEHRRLRWQCRRGMLELDLLLGAFCERDYARLSAEQQADFRRLLEVPDPMLHAWLIGQAVPAEPALRALVEQVRQALMASQTESRPASELDHFVCGGC